MVVFKIIGVILFLVGVVKIFMAGSYKNYQSYKHHKGTGVVISSIGLVLIFLASLFD